MDLIESYSQELRLIDKPWKGFWIALLMIALLLLPWFGSSHLIYVGTVIFVYAIRVQGQNILIGYTGQISISEYVSAPPVHGPVYRAELAAAAPVPVQTGQMQVSLQVSVTYEIK